MTRAALIKDRTAAKNRAKAITLFLLETENKKSITDIYAKMEEIGAAIEQRIQGDPPLTR